MLAVIGGTEPFGLFLERGYDAFHLSRAAMRGFPAAVRCFPASRPQRPKSCWRNHGLKPGPMRVLDAIRRPQPDRLAAMISTCGVSLWTALSLRNHVTNRCESVLIHSDT